MYAFDYHRPTSLRQAASLAGQGRGREDPRRRPHAAADDEAAARRAGELIDLGQIAELRGIERTARSVTIGAMTTHAEVADSADVREGHSGARRAGRR